MKQPTYDLDIYQGADDVYVFSFNSLDAEDNKIPINVSNDDFILTIKKSILDNPVTVLSTEKGNIKLGYVADGSFIENVENASSIQVTFPHILTEQLTAPSYLYDVFRITTDGNREIMFKGNIKVTKSVSYA